MNLVQPVDNEPNLQSAEDSDQFLTFVLGDEQYAVDILKVQEIKGWEGATPMPNVPHYIPGVINLRGTVVPVINLRSYFKFDEIPFTKTTVVIVVRVGNEETHEERTVGIIVDAVSEVHNVKKSELKEIPEISGVPDRSVVKGMATKEENMLIILDIDLLVNKGFLNIVE